MGFVWFIFGALAACVAIWWVSIRIRGAPIRRLLREGLLSEEKYMAFFLIRLVYQRSRGQRLNSDEGVSLALMVAAMPEEWAIAVRHGQIDVNDAVRQLLDDAARRNALGEEMGKYLGW